MCFLFFDPQNKIGPSISSSVVLCFFVILVYIVTLVLVSCLCPSSVRVVATFPDTVLFPLFCALFFSLRHWIFPLSSFVIPNKCLKNITCAASKRCSSLFFSTQGYTIRRWYTTFFIILSNLSFYQLRHMLRGTECVINMFRQEAHKNQRNFKLHTFEYKKEISVLVTILCVVHNVCNYILCCT